MSMVTPTLNLPQPATSSSASARTTGAGSTPALSAAPGPAATTTPPPSTTVTLSPQAMSALAASHSSPASPTAGASTPAAAPAPAAHDGSVYDALKSGISTAVADVGDAIAGGAHAIVNGVETTLSTANKVAVGILELPFAAVAKASDAVGAVLDEL